MWDQTLGDYSTTEGKRYEPGLGRPTVIFVNCVTAPVNAKLKSTDEYRGVSETPLPNDSIQIHTSESGCMKVPP